MRISTHTALVQIHEKLPTVEFNPAWANGLGEYLDNAVHVKLDGPSASAFPDGRKIVLIPNVLGYTTVFFERLVNGSRVCYHTHDGSDLPEERGVAGNHLYNTLKENTYPEGLLAYGLLITLHGRYADTSEHQVLLDNLCA